MGSKTSGNRSGKPRAKGAGRKPHKITLHIGDTFGMLGTKYTVSAILQGNIIRLNYPSVEGKGEILIKVNRNPA